MTDPTPAGAITGSHKTYLSGARPDLRVPMREVPLSTGESMVLYDTSGPWTDPSFEADVRRGLPTLREGWIAERGDTQAYDGRVVRPEDNGRGRAGGPRPGWSV